MTYKEVKNTDVLKLSKDEIKAFKENLKTLSVEDGLKSVNHLRYLKNGSESVKNIKVYMEVLVSLKDVENSRPDLVFGENMDIDVSEKIEVVVETPKTSGVVIRTDKGEEVHTGDIVAALIDDFEIVLVCKTNDVLLTYGFINTKDANYAYLLPNSDQDFLKSIVDAKFGTKVNLRIAFIDLSRYTKKTFSVINFNDLTEVLAKDFIMTNRSREGVVAPVVGGTYGYLKSESILDIFNDTDEKKDEPKSCGGCGDDCDCHGDKPKDIKSKISEDLDEFNDDEDEDDDTTATCEGLEITKTPVTAMVDIEDLKSVKVLDLNEAELNEHIENILSKDEAAIIEYMKYMLDEYVNENVDATTDGDDLFDVATNVDKIFKTPELKEYLLKIHDFEDEGEEDELSRMVKNSMKKVESGENEVEYDDEDEDKIYNADELVFAIRDAENTGNSYDLPMTVALTPKTYWEKERCLADFIGGHNVNNASLIKCNVCECELAEAVFEVTDYEMTREELHEKLVNEGFIYDEEFDEFLK